jgi:hypothetical protein
MKNICLTASAVLYALAFISCNNDDNDADDVYAPTITFIEPADGAILTSGDELHMEVDFTYSGQTIHHIGIYVIDEAHADTLFSFSEHAETDDIYMLHEHIVTSVTESTEYLVEAWSSNEDETQIVSEHVHVTVNP